MKDSQPQVFLVETLELWILLFMHPPDPEATCAMPPPRGLRTLMTHLRIESKLLVSRCCPCCVCAPVSTKPMEPCSARGWHWPNWDGFGEGLVQCSPREVHVFYQQLLEKRSALNLSQFPSPTCCREGQQRLKFVGPARLVRRESSLTLENRSQKSFL